MSRTKHHKDQKHKHTGHDLWGKQGDPGGCTAYNAYNKQVLRRKERGILKKKLNKEV